MLHRLRQGITAILAGADEGIPGAFAEMPLTARMFAALAGHDRRHLAAVRSACADEGLPEDVVVAGLLHDVGKASLSGRSVTLVDRTLKVLLGRFAPRLLTRLAREPAGATIGLHLAVHHPSIGADRLAALGWPDIVTEAVRHHDGDSVTGVRLALRYIDDATP